MGQRFEGRKAAATMKMLVVIGIASESEFGEVRFEGHQLQPNREALALSF